MTRYVLGVDAGGTKTHLVIFTIDGELADYRQWGTLNHEMLPGSFTQFDEEMRRFVGGALQRLGITHGQISGAVMGLGGLDTPLQHGKIGSLLKNQGFVNLTLCNDAYLGIAAGIENGVGICAINGSGTSIAGMNREGKRMQIGGIGGLSDDRGGGSFLGEAVCAAVYRQLYRQGTPTLLTALLFEELQIKEKSEYISRISLAEAEQVAGLNRLLFSAAESGDWVAASILKDCAYNYAGGISCMVAELFLEEATVKIVLAGSVFAREKSPLLKKMLQARLKKLLPDKTITLYSLKAPPVAGAAIWALRLCAAENISVDRIHRQLIEETPRKVDG